MNVFKYPLDLTALNSKGQFILNLPAKAQILSCQIQHGEPMIWALVNPEAPLEPRTIAVVGTGHPVEALAPLFISTIQLGGGSLVFHIFEVLG